MGSVRPVLEGLLIKTTKVFEIDGCSELLMNLLIGIECLQS